MSGMPARTRFAAAAVAAASVALVSGILIADRGAGHPLAGERPTKSVELAGVHTRRAEVRYRAHPFVGGFGFVDAKHRLTARVSAAGLLVRSSGTMLGLSLTGLGRGEDLREVGRVAPQSDGSRVVSSHGSVTETYADGPAGLEETLTLAAPPRGSGDGPLTLALSLSGNTHAVPLARAGAVIFSHRGRSLIYRGLARDAHGHRLRLAVQVRGGRLLVRLADHGALYPLRIDASVQSTGGTSRYATAVLTDMPTAYYRLDEGVGPTAYDSSGNGNDASYQQSPGFGSPGALLGDSDTSITASSPGVMLSQSGDQFPDGNNPRTFEAWVDYVNYDCCNNTAFNLFQYGDAAGGHGFTVALSNDATSITVSGATGTTPVSADTLQGIRNGWHMIDVTYDGNVVEVYQDGQVIGGGPLGAASTTVPGQGMQIDAEHQGFGLDEVAVYPTALSPEQIDAHWTAGGSTPDQSACAAAPSARYPSSVLAAAPLAYYRLDETAADPTDRVAFDSSSHCDNATYVGTSSSAGGLSGDADTAVSAGSSGVMLSQSGEQLPAANSPRTLEAWIQYVNYDCCNNSGFNLFQYGDVAGGSGFTVALGNDAATIEVSGGSASTPVTANTLQGIRNGWHLIDVTYDGNTADIYQDGQLIGSRALGAAGTVLPGQGLQVNAEHQSFELDEVAIYGAALSPERIDANWTAGASPSGTRACASAPTAPYATTVLADSPAMYYRLDDAAGDRTDRVAFDSSPHCANATYVGTSPSGGALVGDSDTAVTAGSDGVMLSQSGDQLPAGNSPRTFEAWVDYVNYDCCNNAAFTLFQYGDLAGNHGFSIGVTNDAGAITVNGATTSVSATTLAGIRNGWHLIDVTYDGGTGTTGTGTVDIYEDGQVIGGGTLGDAATVLPGQGLQVNAEHQGFGLDEVAVFPAALTPRRVLAHWDAQSLTPPGTSIIAGTATEGGGPATGARVQVCPTSGSACQVDPNPVDPGGEFHMIVPNDTYTVTIFPPSGSPSGPVTDGPITVPPKDTTLSAAFTAPGGLPSGMTVTSPPGGATQQNVVPVVNWGNPTTFTVTDCKGGIGAVYLQAPNTSTGQTDTRAYALTETPAGSGNYTAQIPALSPLHGLGTLRPLIECPNPTHMLPDGGPSAGGTSVLISGSGLTGATAVSFGGAPAAAFVVQNDNLIIARSPAGSGSVPVSVTTASGTTINVGNYDYFDVTGVSPAAGSTLGGNTVTITGHGFNSVVGVVFGLVPSDSVTVVNDTEIQATVPAGFGTVNVSVLNGQAVSTPSPSDQYTYQSGPPGSANIVEPTSGGDGDAQSLAIQVQQYCASQDCAGLGYGDVQDGAETVTTPVSSPAGSPQSDGVPWWDGAGVLDGEFAIGACLVVAPCDAVVATITAAGFIISAIADVHDECAQNPGGLFGLCHLFIDPSGTVVDQAGNPIGGATATLLGQGSSGGAFVAVDPSSGAIEPAVNPQTTDSTGEFDWDALAGTYEVEASKSGCHAPGNASEPNVFTSPFAIPPPAVGLMLTLDCGSSSPPTPAVTGVSPGEGPTGGGNTVDITGTGLVGAAAVHFGNAAATNFEVLSPYAIAAVAPAGSGAVEITVSTAGGTSATGGADTYSYIPPAEAASGPTISSISPASGPLTGGTLVTITGTNLDGAYGVTFGGAGASQVTDVSPTEIQAVAPAAQFPGRVDTAVTTSNGTSPPVAADIYTYGAPTPPPVPTVWLAVSPNPASFHEQVTLTAAVSQIDGGGLVAFYDGTVADPISGCGALPLTADGGGTYHATCASSTLSLGDHTITAGYSGDTSYASASQTGTASVMGPPANTALPSISGNTTQGQTLNESHGAWTFSPTSYSYQWEDCDASGNACSSIAGASGQSYTLTASDVGHTVRVLESATNGFGTGGPISSVQTGVVALVGSGPPVNSIPPVVSGAATKGKTVSSSTGTWSGAPPLSYSYQWQRCAATCTDLAGATASTYTPNGADVGARLRAVVTAANNIGSASAKSNEIGPVQPAPAQIAAALRHVLAPSGKAANLGAIVKEGGFTFTFNPPGIGKLTIAWYEVPDGAHLARKAKPKPVLVALATQRFAGPGTRAVRVKLTGAGKRLLPGSRTVRLTSEVTFTAAGGTPSGELGSFSLRR